MPLANYHCFDCDQHILFDTEVDEQHTISFSLAVHTFFAPLSHIMHAYKSQNKYYIEGPEPGQKKAFKSRSINRSLRQYTLVFQVNGSRSTTIPMYWMGRNGS